MLICHHLFFVTYAASTDHLPLHSKSEFGFILDFFKRLTRSSSLYDMKFPPLFENQVICLMLQNS